MENNKWDFNKIIEQNFTEFLTDLKQIIEIKSVRSKSESHAPFGIGPREVLNSVVKIAQKYGFKTGIVNDAVAYAQWGPDDENYLGIVGHLDVVPAGEDWLSNPFILEERGEALYGRGILDNKGPIISTLFAMKLLKDLGYQPKNTIRILFGSDEECGSHDISLYLKDEAAPQFGFTPDCKFPVVYGERGIVNYEIITPIPDFELEDLSWIEGDQARDHIPDNLSVKLRDQLFDAHGTRSPTNAPELGDNAIMILAKKLSNQIEIKNTKLSSYLKWLIDSFDRKYFGEGINLNLKDEDSGRLIVSPYYLNKIEGGLKLEVAIRYPVSFDERTITDGIKKAILPGSKVNVIRKIPGMMHDKNDPKLKVLSDAYASVTHMDGTPVTTTGATYARSVPNIVAFGPSFPGQKGIAHKQDEWMKIADLKLNMEIYMYAILGLMQMEDKD